MSPTLAEVTPLSTGTQAALHIPVILVALAGVVLALVFARRLGLPSAILAALGSAVVAGDQTVNVIWAYATNAEAERQATSAEIITTQNSFAIVDAVLITIGVGLLVVALALVRRKAGPAPSYAGPSHAPQSYPAPAFPAPGYGPPQPGYGPPASGFPPPPATAPPYAPPSPPSPGE